MAQGVQLAAVIIPWLIVMVQSCPVAFATSGPIRRSPTHTTFASLCSRARCAEVTSCTVAARTPEILFAAIAMPVPAYPFNWFCVTKLFDAPLASEMWIPAGA